MTIHKKKLASNLQGSPTRRFWQSVEPGMRPNHIDVRSFYEKTHAKGRDSLVESIRHPGPKTVAQFKKHTKPKFDALWFQNRKQRQAYIAKKKELLLRKYTAATHQTVMSVPRSTIQTI